MAGLWDSIQSALNAANSQVAQGMTSPLFNLGMGMVAGGTGLNNQGTALQGAANNYQQQQAAAQQLAMTRMQMQMLQQQGPQVSALLSSIYGGGQGAPQPAGAAAAPQSPSASPAGAAASQGAQGVSGGLLGVSAPPAGAQPSAAPSGAPGAAGSSSGPNPWQLISAGTQLQGTMLPQWQAQGKAMVAQGQAILANDPRYVTQKATAGNVLTQDQALIQNAQSPQARQAAQIKYLTDAGMVHVANNNGAVTTLGGLTPGQVGAGGVNPEQGLGYANGQEYALPGAPQAQAALAAARAGGQQAGQAPYDMEEVTDGSGNRYLVPKSQLLAPGTPGGARPAGAPAAPALAALGPQAQAGLQGRGIQSADYVTTLQKASDDATTSNYALDNVVQSARGATLGPGAPAREFVEKGFTALAQTLDPTFTPPAELGSYMELAKYGNQLGFASARTMGSREAAQIVNMAIASNPNKELTPQAFGWIANSMKAMNNYVIAKSQAVQGADKQAPGAAQQAAATWNAKVSPQAWDLSLDPGMAAQLAPKLGADKIASSMPFMASPDAVAAFRNIPASMRAAVLAKLPPAVKQELAQGLRQ